MRNITIPGFDLETNERLVEFDEDHLNATWTEAGYRYAERRASEDWKNVAPPRFHGAMLDSLAPEQRQVVDEFLAAAPTPNLMLIGPVGSGKTHTALAAARELFVKQSLEVEFAPVVRLLDNMRPDARNRGASEWEHGLPWIEFYSSVDVLVLDDLGGEKPSEWTAERLYLIVNERWLNQRPTVATTNLAPDDLKEAIGHRTYDRLRDGALALQLGGESWRKPL